MGRGAFESPKPYKVNRMLNEYYRPWSEESYKLRIKQLFIQSIFFINKISFISNYQINTSKKINTQKILIKKLHNEDKEVNCFKHSDTLACIWNARVLNSNQRLFNQFYWLDDITQPSRFQSVWSILYSQLSLRIELVILIRFLSSI
jgi:hypothetical protein